MPRGRFGPDITGMRSGMVVALERSEEKRRGSILWRCRCDCGKEFLTEGYKISGQRIQSCGCLRNAHQFKDLRGQRFGRLTAIERLNEKRGKDTSYLWLCRCDCGKEIKVSVNALLNGHYTSCGCGKRERMQQQAMSIAGQRCGRLTALKATDKRGSNESVIWQCRCDCGKETEVPYGSLASGNTRSCGCLTKELPGPQAYMRYIDGTCVELLERRKLRRDNTSGYTGVQWNKRKDKWQALITFKGKTYNLGFYNKIEDAAEARKEAENRIFGEFLDWYYEQYPERRPTAEQKPHTISRHTVAESEARV